MQTVLMLPVQTLRAGTDVAAGQELTICYQDVATAGRQRRQETLQRSFNFVCCCEVAMLRFTCGCKIIPSASDRNLPAAHSLLSQIVTDTIHKGLQVGLCVQRSSPTARASLLWCPTVT
jgi:hypothetical protein